MKKPYILNYAETSSFSEQHLMYYDGVSQLNYINKEKTIKAITFGPDRTSITESIENDDSDEQYLGPDTTTKTAFIENSDEDDFYLNGPDKTTWTFVVENGDEDEQYVGPETTVTTRAIENDDTDDFLIM